MSFTYLFGIKIDGYCHLSAKNINELYILVEMRMKAEILINNGIEGTP